MPEQNYKKPTEQELDDINAGASRPRGDVSDTGPGPDLSDHQNPSFQQQDIDTSVLGV